MQHNITIPGAVEAIKRLRPAWAVSDVIGNAALIGKHHGVRD
jgi:hypothetical protein